ncbi:MAG: DUF2812 domain-containing protein [Monoglobus pectinilyticus]|uniref:DUF2812 domain-containing protein n=1 Tax=Monoglobus pectinilyticus TaxID=1981510 RepID=UPI00399C0F19
MKRIFPIDLSDIGGVESYLSDMAAEGFFIKKLGLIAEYEKLSPKKATYRLEPLMKDEMKPNDSIIDGYNEFVWKYVCTDENRLFHVFVSFDERPDEIHTDIETQKYSFDYLAKRIEKNKKVSIIGIALYLLILLMCSLTSVFDMRYYIESGSAVWLQTFIFFSILILILNIINSFRLKRIYTNLKSGVPIKHRKKYKKRYTAFILTTTITILSVTRIGITIYGMNSNWTKDLDTFNSDLPAITLYDIEPERFEIKDDIYNGVNMNNSIEYTWSEFAPTIYEVRQRGEVADRRWKDNSGIYSPSIKTKYYDLRFKHMRKILLNSIMDYELELYKYEEIVSEELYDTSFDYARIVKVNESQMLFAYYENKVIYVDYYGYGDLKSCIDKIYNKIV